MSFCRHTKGGAAAETAGAGAGAAGVEAEDILGGITATKEGGCDPVLSFALKQKNGSIAEQGLNVAV